MPMSTNIARRRLLAGAALALCAGAQAQTAYPDKPIRFIVPYATGGATDAVARMIGAKLSESWGQQVIIENRTGAGGQIGNSAVAKAAPDGYTVLIAITQLIQAESLYAKPPYVLADFAPVAQMTAGPVLLVVHHSVPANTLQEFVALVKSKPGIFAFGSYGVGSSAHISGEMLNRQAGLDMQHVPFRGASALATDLLGGQITVGFIDTGTVRPHLASGKLKILAVTGPQRHKTVPQVPTFAELGYKNFEPTGWTGVFLPAATPKDIVKKLSDEIVRIVRTPEITQRIDAYGLAAAAKGVEEFSAAVPREAAIWQQVIREAGIRLD